MASVISLHQRQAFLPTGLVAAYAKLNVYLTGTATQVNVYSDAGLTSQRSQPINADAEGVFPVCYVSEATPLRLLATDEDDVPLPGYPMDNITPFPTDDTGAVNVVFAPTESIPETNVQDAIEHVASLVTDQTTLNARAYTPWVTGGSGDNYTITPTPAITAYGGNTFVVRPDRANTTTTPTLNVNGLGTRPLRRMGTALTPSALLVGEIQPGQEFSVYDDGTTMYMFSTRHFVVTGTSADGRWVRASDGLQICTKRISGQGPISTAEGSLFRSATIDLGAWPIAFNTGTTVIRQFSTGHASAHSWLAGLTEPTVSGAGSAQLYRATTSAATDYVIHVTGLGRWF